MGNADYKVEIVDANGNPDLRVAVVGDQVVDVSGAADGDVLTVQPDGTVAPEPPSAGTATALHNQYTRSSVTVPNGASALVFNPTTDANFEDFDLDFDALDLGTFFVELQVTWTATAGGRRAIEISPGMDNFSPTVDVVGSADVGLQYISTILIVTQEVIDDEANLIAFSVAQTTGSDLDILTARCRAVKLA